LNTALKLSPDHAALLVMDFQADIVRNFAKGQETLLASTRATLAAARRTGMRVIYVVVGFRSGYPEVSAHNATFSSIRQTGRFVQGAPGSEFEAQLAPEPGDVTVVKHRVSAFAGTDLDMILRAGGIDTLVLTGIATSGVVLSTLRHAADADYRLVVLKDCCADADPEVHAVLMDKVFPRQATIATAADFQAAVATSS